MELVLAPADLRWNSCVFVVVVAVVVVDPFDYLFFGLKLSRSLTWRDFKRSTWGHMTVDVQPLERLEVILPDMGSGTSRGKRVAPARVSEAHAILRVSARHRAQQPECRGDGRDPERSSRDDDDDAAIEADADTAVADEQEQSWACVKKSPSNQKKKKVVKKKKEEKEKKSRTYGLCRSRQEDEESGAEEPRGSRVVNKRAFLQVGKQTAAPSGHLTVRTFSSLQRLFFFSIFFKWRF